MKTNWKILATVLICLLAAGNLMAQSARGGIQGVVSDSDGQMLPGVTVTISSVSMQGTKSTVTDSNGLFRFSLVPPGTYTAIFTLSGFQRLEQQNVRVGLEKTISLDVSLSSTFTEEVLVTAESPVIDTTSPAIGSDIGAAVLNDVPLGREFNSIIYLAAGAVDGGGMANDAIGSNPSIMGASALENRYVVDQLDTTDVAEGRAGTQISTSFIAEMQVKVGGYEAEYGGALGGVVNMITKSGGNEFHGDVFGYYSNDSMWADAKVPETRGDSRTVDNEWDVGFTVGGKIIADKLWFFVGYNPNTLDQVIVNDVFSGFTGDLMQTNNILRTFDKQFYSAKLTWQLNQNNSITGTVLGDPTTIENDFSTTNFIDSPFTVTDQFYDTESGGLNWGVNWNSVLSQNLLLEASYGHHQSKQEFVPNTDITAYQDQTTIGLWTGGAGGSVFFGGPQFQQPKDDRTRNQARIAFSWFLGQHHELKIGGGWNDVEYEMIYGVPGPSDAFCSPTIEGGPYEYDFFTGTTPQIGTNCSVSNDGVMDGFAMPARIGNRYRLRNGYYYNRNYKNSSTGTTEEFNIYAQDSWQIAPNFTLAIGLRAESSNSQGNLTNILPERQLDFGFGDMIAPRIGFAWDFTGDGRSKIYGHYGKFYQSIPLTINVRSFGNENYDFYFYEYPDSGIPDTLNPGTLTYIYRSSSELTFLDPNVKPQYLEEYILGGEYEVATDIAIGLKYIRRELGRVIEDISVDQGSSYFITNPGGTFTENPTNGIPLDPPVDFPAATRDFDGIELSMSKRFSNRWQGYASLLWSKLEGNYEGLYSRDNQQIDPNITSKFDLPDLLDNAFGLLQNNREWQFKMFGSYRADFGLVSGLNMWYMTGNPISKLGAHRVYGLDERFVTARGTEGTTESWLNFDLAFSYPIQLGNFQLDLMLDIFNIFDEQAAVEVDQRWTTCAPGDEDEPGCSDVDAQTNDTWGEPLVFSRARNFRVGVRFAW